MTELATYQVQLSDGGLLMGPGTPITVVNIEGLLDRDVRDSDYNRANADGAVTGPDYMNPKPITLTLKIRGATPAAALATYRTVKAAWNSGRLTEGVQASLPLRFRLPGELTHRFQNGRPRRIGLDLSTIETRNLRALATYVANDPREYGDIEKAIVLPYGDPSQTLPNAGNQPAAVTWDLQGVVTNPGVIRSEAARFDLTTTVASATFHRVRTDAKTVTRSSDSANVYPEFSGTWLEVPPGGALFRSVGSGYGAAVVIARYRDTWF